MKKITIELPNSMYDYLNGQVQMDKSDITLEEFILIHIDNQIHYTSSVIPFINDKEYMELREKIINKIYRYLYEASKNPHS